MLSNLTEQDVANARVNWAASEAVVVAMRGHQERLTKQMKRLKAEDEEDRRSIDESRRAQSRVLRTFLERLPDDHPLFLTKMERRLYQDESLLHPVRVIPMVYFLRERVELKYIRYGDSVTGFGWGRWRSGRHDFVEVSRKESGTLSVGAIPIEAYYVEQIMEKFDFDRFLTEVLHPSLSQ